MGPRHEVIDFLRRSQFRVRFEAKGRFRDYLKSIPVHVITHPDAAFIGLTALLFQERDQRCSIS